MVDQERDVWVQAHLEQYVLEKLALQVGVLLVDSSCVHENWLLLAAIAQPLMEFPLPQSLDPAPRFEP